MRKGAWWRVARQRGMESNAGYHSPGYSARKTMTLRYDRWPLTNFFFPMGFATVFSAPPIVRRWRGLSEDLLLDEARGVVTSDAYLLNDQLDPKRRPKRIE